MPGVRSAQGWAMRLRAETDFKQLLFMINQIRKKAQYTPDQLKSADPEKKRNEDFQKKQA